MSSSAFQREERYIVIKRKGLEAYKEEDIRELLADHLVDTVECVVVESDWPEYEVVWGMIETRCTGEQVGSSNMVPGTLRCAKCDFRLIKTLLTPQGAFANPAPDECPNCHVPMWRVSWEEEAKDAYKTAESQMMRAITAELANTAKDATIAQMLEVLGKATSWIENEETSVQGVAELAMRDRLLKQCHVMLLEAHAS